MCMACRQRGPQGTFARVRRGADGRVSSDPTARSGGRGAYICVSEPCVKRATESRALVKALRLPQPPSLEEIKTLQQTLTARLRAWDTASEQGGTADGG